MIPRPPRRAGPFAHLGDRFKIFQDVSRDQPAMRLPESPHAEFIGTAPVGFHNPVDMIMLEIGNDGALLFFRDAGMLEQGELPCGVVPFGKKIIKRIMGERENFTAGRDVVTDVLRGLINGSDPLRGLHGVNPVAPGTDAVAGCFDLSDVVMGIEDLC